MPAVQYSGVETIHKVRGEKKAWLHLLLSCVPCFHQKQSHSVSYGAFITNLTYARCMLLLIYQCTFVQIVSHVAQKNALISQAASVTVSIYDRVSLCCLLDSWPPVGQMKRRSRSSGTNDSLHRADKKEFCSRTAIAGAPDRIQAFRLHSCSHTRPWISFA